MVTPIFKYRAVPAQSFTKTLPSIPASISSHFKAPKPHFMLGLINTHKRLENSIGIQATLLNADIQKDLNEMDRLEKEKSTRVLELEKTSSSQKKWSILSSAAQYAVSSSTIALALASKGTKTLPGLMLLASGVIGLSNRVFHDTGFYKTFASWITKSQELQEKLATRIEMGMFSLSLGLGLTGGLWGHKESMIAMGEKTRAIASKLHIGAGLGKTGIDFQNSLIQKKADHGHAALQRINSCITQAFQRISAFCKEVEKSVSSLGTLGEELKEIIRSLRYRN